MMMTCIHCGQKQFGWLFCSHCHKPDPNGWHAEESSSDLPAQRPMHGVSSNKISMIQHEAEALLLKAELNHGIELWAKMRPYMDEYAMKVTRGQGTERLTAEEYLKQAVEYAQLELKKNGTETGTGYQGESNSQSEGKSSGL